MAPAVSILMPTFNRLEFLPAAIGSVLAQTFNEWELIIADDGSGSDTRSYLQSLADRRVRVLWMAHSGKPAVMLNAALQSACGEYVAFLDSDDMWQPRKLELQVASLRRQPTRRWGCTGFALVDAAGRPLAAPRSSNCPAPSGWVRERLLTDAVVAMPSVIAARGLLEQVGPLDEELVMCYDDELWLRLAAASELDAIDEPLTLVRRHAAHAGSDIIAWRDRRRVVEKTLRNIEDAHFAAILREQRAVMSAGLARSHALYGKRIDVVRTLAASAAYSWRYRQWWSGGLRAAGQALTPRVVRRAVRRALRAVRA
ncbi:MAG TPA: glycosyltransferase family A protein [Steroidobacteraceae bacterium]|nr:glycosyltransferase family A protein [Steroidobacteraceae bacterium]